MRASLLDAKAVAQEEGIPSDVEWRDAQLSLRSYGGREAWQAECADEREVLDGVELVE